MWRRSDKQKMIENWKRVWVVLDETKLYLINDKSTHEQGSNGIQIQVVIDLLFLYCLQSADFII